MCEAQGLGKASPFTKELTFASLRAASQLLHSEPSHATCILLHFLADKFSKVHICLSLLSCQNLSAACMHIFSFTHTFFWHTHAHIHCRTCLRHTCMHTWSKATAVTRFFPLLPLLSPAIRDTSLLFFLINKTSITWKKKVRKLVTLHPWQPGRSLHNWGPTMTNDFNFWRKV